MGRCVLEGEPGKSFLGICCFCRERIRDALMTVSTGSCVVSVLLVVGRYSLCLDLPCFPPSLPAGRT